MASRIRSNLASPSVKSPSSRFSISLVSGNRIRSSQSFFRPMLFFRIYAIDYEKDIYDIGDISKGDRYDHPDIRSHLLENPMHSSIRSSRRSARPKCLSGGPVRGPAVLRLQFLPLLWWKRPRLPQPGADYVRGQR